MFAYTKIMQGIQAVSAAVTDAYFNLVTLLLPGNGTNGAQNNTFLDSSTNNFTITRNGNTTQGTFSPFSQTGWSNYFNGSTDYFNFAAQSGFSFGTGDWAIETFVYLTSTADQAIYDARPTSTNGLYPLVDIAGGKFRYYTNSASRIESDSTFSTNRWYHIVVSRVSGTTRMFIDGTVQSTTYTDSNNYIVGTNRPTIGVGGFNLTAHLSGYMSNMRVLKGSGYTSVTVPTAPLTAVTNTQLLTCQSNRFVDNSTNNFTITRNGDVSVQAFSPFAPTAAYSAATNGGSGYFDGTGDYLSSTISALAGAFSIEFWFYRPASGNNFCFTIGDSNTGGNTSAEVYIGTSGTVLNYWANNAAQITGTPAPTGQWVYLAVTRDASNVVRLYQNGTQVGGTYTQSGTLSTALRIGTEWYNGASTGTTNGYIGNFRVSNNVRTVTTIPTSPFSNDGNTVFLANFTNAGITDATAKNVLETVGNAQISTTQSKFGGSSMYFDGTGDYVLTAPRASNILGNGDFTVEFWAYPSNTSSAFRALVSSENYAGVAGGWSIYQNGTSLEIWLTSGQIINATSALTSSTWQHVALSRASGTVRLFVNGTSVGSVSNSVEWTGQQIYVGDNNYSGIDYFYIGYIDDLRITKGYARYTSSFTPPTAAFPLS